MQNNNTKTMYEYLKKQGVIFERKLNSQNVSVWKAYLENQVIAQKRELGYLIWDVAEKIGE